MTPQILYGVLSQAYFKNADNYEKVYSFWLIINSVMRGFVVCHTGIILNVI